MEFPTGKYATVVIDPPWHMEKIKRRVAPNQVGFDYKTMTIEQIRELPIPSILTDDSFVFMWTTQKYLPYSWSILEWWGLKYRFCMVWYKNGGFQPFNCPQFNCEFVVVGAKGNPQFISQKKFNTVFYAKRQGHSVKPEEFYSLLRRVTPEPRIDIFNRRHISGFDGWGDESPDEIGIELLLQDM